MFNWFQVCDGTMTAVSTRQTARATTSTACPSWLDSPAHLTRAGLVRSGEKTSIKYQRGWTLLLSSFEIWWENNYKIPRGWTLLLSSFEIWRENIYKIPRGWTLLLSSFEIWRENIYKNMGLTFLSRSSCLLKSYFTCFTLTRIVHYTYISNEF